MGLGLTDLMAARAQGRVADGHNERSVIMIFNLGAPSQIDSWDMKPEAPAEIRGPFKPIKTNATASRSRKSFRAWPSMPTSTRWSAVAFTRRPRCMTPGHQMMQTGRLFTGGINTPHAGCALAYLRGRKRICPPHVILPEPMGRTGGNLPHGQDAGFLGKAQRSVRA